VFRLLSNLSENDLTGRRVFLRADLDVEISAAGEVLEDFRLQAMQATFEFLLAQGVGQIIIAGHLGRPEGAVKDDLRLNLVSKRLSEIIGWPIKKLDEAVPQELPADKIVMLENLRFESGEESNDESFARKLASYADVYVNECFSTSHRAHASLVGVPKILPSYAGLQLAREIKTLSTVLKNPARPLVVIIGGAKLETKVPVVNNLKNIADTILVGGKIGFDPQISAERTPSSGQAAIITPTDDIDQKDLGPQTTAEFVGIIKTAKTVVWNGPLGMFEDEKYTTSTKAIAEAVVNPAAKAIVGGGDTIASLQKLGLLDKMGFVSTGGGAMLCFLAGQPLPGLIALE